MPRVTKYSDFPSVYTCNLCDETKLIEQMIVIHSRSENCYRMRPRCKDCHNAKERGNRRDYKTKYLKNWRKRNKKLNESYWKGNPIVREKARLTAMNRFTENHEAMLIQGRMRRKGMPVTLAEAQELLQKFGRCYPTRFGLSKKGLSECERIRSRLRVRKARKINLFDIRLSVYEDALEDTSLMIAPRKQPIPYKSASNTMKKFQAKQRQKLTQAAGA